MKQKLFTILTLLLCICSTAWGQTTLVDVDFSTWTTGNLANGTTKDGVTINSNGTNMSIATVNKVNYLNFGANKQYNRCVAIPLSNINGKINVTLTCGPDKDGASNGNINYQYAFYENTSTIKTDGNSTGFIQTDRNATSISIEIETNYTTGVLYIGRSGSSYIYLKGITITTPVSVPSLTGGWKISDTDVTGQTANVAQGSTATLPTFTVGATSGNPTADDYVVAYSLKAGSTEGIFTFDAGVPTAISTEIAGTATVVATLTTQDDTKFLSPATNTFEYTVNVSAASAPSITIGASSTEVTAGTAITLTASDITGVPTPTIKWYVSNTNDTSAGEEIVGETSNTYEFNAVAGTKYYYAKAFNSVVPTGVASNVVAITAAARTGYTLNQVVYSNGFDAFIKAPDGDANGTIKAYYLAGTAVPTIASTTMSPGATYNVESNTLTITSEDGLTSKVYDITLAAVEPYTEDGITFNGTENWVKTGNAFSNVSGKKGWKFSKNDNDWTREMPGQNRIYLFLGPSTSVTLANGGTSRNINVYKNGVKLNTPTSSGSCTIAGDTENAYMIAIVSNQTSGDGAFISISVTGAQTTATTETITPAKQYITYVPNHNLDFTSTNKLTAYIVKETTASAVTLSSVDNVPAGTPIIVEATEIGSPIAVNITASKDDVSGNLLVMGDGATIMGGDSKYDYILSDGKFYRSNEGVMAAGKAYLHLTSEPGAGARELTLSYEGSTTAINGIEEVAPVTKTRKVVKNGRLVIETANGEFTVSGARIK